jgi:hypothetical protein
MRWSSTARLAEAMRGKVRGPWMAGSVLALSGVSATSAWAIDVPDSHDNAQPCRPTITCTADITSPGTLEVEAGGQWEHTSGRNEGSFPFLLKQTFLSWLQLQVGSNGYTLLRDGIQAQYLDNVVIGPKLHLVDQGKLAPSLAVSAEVSVPTFDATGYNRYIDLFLVTYASKDLGPIHVDLNGGAYLWRLEALEAQAFVSGVLSMSLPLNLGPELEGYYFSDAAPVASHDGGVRAAMTWKARPWLVLDLGGDVGFFPSVREFTLFAGLTVIPVVFYRTGPPPKS